MTQQQRCPWPDPKVPGYIEYHDTEWGVPVHDDFQIFEGLILDGAQAGLSWATILKRRAHYHEAFCQGDFYKVAEFSDEDLAELLLNPGLIRNRAKIFGARATAKACVQIAHEWGSLDKYFWHFFEGKPLTNSWEDIQQVPASTPLSEQISTDLKKRGCTFVGPTIIYAFLQAKGFINDHLTSCFRHKECQKYS